MLYIRISALLYCAFSTRFCFPVLPYLRSNCFQCWARHVGPPLSPNCCWSPLLVTNRRRVFESAAILQPQRAHSCPFPPHPVVPITALLYSQLTCPRGCHPHFWPRLWFEMGYKLNSLGALLLVIILYFIQQRQRRNTARQQKGCAPLVQHQPAEPFFGLDFIIKIHKDIPSLHRFHQDHGHTFQLNSLVGPPTIHTVAPENLRLIHTEDEKWGIEPYRLAGMEPFCGRGFLTMDGDVWRHARRALRPSFAKNNLVDLSILSREVDKIEADLPKNGGTVDLQPLFYVTVRCSSQPLQLCYTWLTRYSF